MLPEVAPPVEKFVPAQVVALALLQVNVDESPCVMDPGFADMETEGAQLGVVKEYPSDVPPFQ